jgi:hypothetical protein
MVANGPNGLGDEIKLKKISTNLFLKKFYFISSIEEKGYNLKNQDKAEDS